MCFYMQKTLERDEEDTTMFCSRCGKTIRMADSVCPSCGSPIGGNRFSGSAYTSAQEIYPPDEQSFEQLNNYTRTTYTNMSEAAQEAGEVDSRTTYRPVYEGASTPQSVREDMKAALQANNEPEIEEEVQEEEAPAFIPGVPLSAAARRTLGELDEDLKPDEEIDLSQFKSRPIQATSPAGISQEVTDYIRKLEDNQAKKAAARKKSEPVYDDYAAGERDEAFAPMEDGEADEADTYEDFDEDQYEDMDDERRIGVAQILKVLAALLVVAALAFGIVKWVGYIRSNSASSPIDGVSQSLYDEGIALLKSHVEADYISGMVSQYNTQGALVMSNSIQQDKAAIQALMPAEPAANDATFLEALVTIQDNIESAIIMDALAVGSSSENAAADSEARWTIVNNSILQLESVKSAAELTGIINGQVITVQAETPAPTQAPEAVTYNSLSKGDEGNAVLNLQNRLYALGFLTGDRDGVFGSKTQTAVKLFQEAAGLPASGIADNPTQQRLYADDAPYAAGAATPTPKPTATPAPTEPAIQPAEVGSAA